MRAQSVMVFFYSDVDWLHSGAFVEMYISANNATFYVLNVTMVKSAVSMAQSLSSLRSCSPKCCCL
jgi:hypothetical protein